MPNITKIKHFFIVIMKLEKNMKIIYKFVVSCCNKILILLTSQVYKLVIFNNNILDQNSTCKKTCSIFVSYYNKRDSIDLLNELKFKKTNIKINH